MGFAKAVLIAVAAAGIPAAPFAAHAQSSRATVPDTPAGTILRAWLEAFNSGDSLRLDAYYRQYDPVRPGGTALWRQTGGLDLISVERTEPRHIEVTLKERSGQRVAYHVLTTPPDGSTKVATHRLLWLGANGSADALRMDGPGRARVLEGALAQLEGWYVFPEIAKQAGDSLRARLGRGAYDHYTSGPGFAVRLHDELREITRDKHVQVSYSVPEPSPTPSQPAGRSSPTDIAQQQAQADANNCSFVKVEVLPGNIGYLKFNKFEDPNLCAPTASAAMNSLAGTTALIVDLRENIGGSPAMEAHISSYLFSRRTQLNSVWTRNSGRTNHFWTSEDVPGPKFGGEKPVYVLTANLTFSAAEAFAYNLKSNQRAVIVGETTGGGAHPVSPHRIDDHFTIRVPFARAINPITKTNWEGVGVEPDVQVPSAEALTAALRLLAEKTKN